MFCAAYDTTAQRAELSMKNLGVRASFFAERKHSNLQSNSNIYSLGDDKLQTSPTRCISSVIYLRDLKVNLDSFLLRHHLLQQQFFKHNRPLQTEVQPYYCYCIFSFLCKSLLLLLLHLLWIRGSVWDWIPNPGTSS